MARKGQSRDLNQVCLILKLMLVLPSLIFSLMNVFSCWVCRIWTRLQPQNASGVLPSEGQAEYSPCTFSLAFCLSAGCRFGVACLGPILRLCCPRREWCIKTGDSLFTSRALINGKLEWNWYMHMTCTLIPNVFIVINAITMNTKGIREWLATLSICYGLFKKVKHRISWGLRSDVSFSRRTWL